MDDFNLILQKYKNMSLDEYMRSDEVFNLAYSFLMEKKYEESILHFQRSILLRPDHIALAYSGLGQNKKAMECLDKALSLDPDYEPAIFNRQNIMLLKEGEPLISKRLDVSYYHEKAQRKKLKTHNMQTISV